MKTGHALEVDFFHCEPGALHFSMDNGIERSPLWQRPKSVGYEDTALQIGLAFFPGVERIRNVEREKSVEILERRISGILRRGLVTKPVQTKEEKRQ